MIPIKLELQGLYSYKEKQTIDFTQLTAAGLFGIFGAVGSGKSSILEAIMLSLYGNTERLASRGEKTSMVNLQSDMLYISFEFRAGKNNGETYKALYTSRRNKKNFDDVKPAEHNFYILKPEGWEPIAARGEALVGMKMEHFRQTVIIPQGKFRDFIEQKPLARAEMMKELFGLERFDLSSNTLRLLRKVLDEKIRLETQLKTLEEVTLEYQREKEELFEDLAAEKSKVESNLLSLEATCSQLEKRREKHRQWLNLQDRAEKLLAEKPAVEEKRATLNKFRKAVAFIKPLMTQLKEKEIEIEKYEVSLRECSRWKSDYEEKVAGLEAEEQRLKVDQNKKSEREAKIRDLQKVVQINALQKELEQLQSAVDHHLLQSEKSKKLLTKLQHQISDLEAREEGLPATDAQELANLQQMEREYEQLEKAESKLSEEVESLSLKKSSAEERIEGLRSLLPENVSEFGELVHHQEQLLENQRQQKEILIHRQGLAAYAGSLTDGTPCPLCGSPDHPSPLYHRAEDGQLKEITGLIQQSKSELEVSRKNKESWEKEIFERDLINSQLDSKSSELSQKRLERETLIRKLERVGIPGKEGLLLRLEQSRKNLDARQQLADQLRRLRKDFQKQNSQYEDDQNKLRLAEQKLLTVQATLVAQKGEIKIPEFSFRYLNLPEEQILQDIDKVQKRINELELNIKRNQDRLKEARQGQATNLANLKNFENLLAETTEKQRLLQEDLEAQLKVQGFARQEEAADLLDSPVAPEEWERQIKAYESQVEITRDRLGEFSEDREVQDFKEEVYQEKVAILAAEKETFEKVKTRHTLLRQELEEISVKLQQKDMLNKDMSGVEKREMNLRELEKLFKGNGFVKFMSSIYLKELCLTANTRFMKLTKNSLSLEIDEDNNFWVRDYLNGGKKRLLKSLSGGQTFQASLCLALALAEKVKALNRADQSFFFLDEGFGALDKPSLRTVFEALKTLRHENRVVGIISHVEELQQEIEVYAKVELDGERGSLVSYSF